MNSGELDRCREARSLLAADSSSTAHRRGAAVLARQSIESVLRAAMGRVEHRELSWRTRFVVLALRFEGLDARRGHQLWNWWSGIVHFHPYDLVPEASVIAARIDDTEAWVTRAQHALLDPPARFRKETP